MVHDYAGHPPPTDLSRELARRGHTVQHVYFGGDMGPKGQLERSPTDPLGLSFIGIRLPRPYEKASFVKRRFDDIAYGKAVAEFARREQPDVLISGNTPTEAQSSIVKACTEGRTAFVYWVQDFYSIAVSKLLGKKLGVPGALIGAYYRFLERHQFRSSQSIVVITQGFEGLARKWARDHARVITIENWGALSNIYPLEKDNSWSRRHNLHNSFNFLYSGTLGLKHNPALLVELAKSVAGRANVVVVSHGIGVSYLEEEKQKQALTNLVLLPLQPVAELPEVLASSDVAVATIEPDAGMFSVPSKVLSYLCARRAVLLAAPRENLSAQIITDNRAGLVIEPTDISGYIDAAHRLLTDNSFRSECSANGHQYALENYDIALVTDRFEKVFRYAIEAKAEAKKTKNLILSTLGVRGQQKATNGSSNV